MNRKMCFWRHCLDIFFFFQLKKKSKWNKHLFRVKLIKEKKCLFKFYFVFALTILKIFVQKKDFFSTFEDTVLLYEFFI